VPLIITNERVVVSFHVFLSLVKMKNENENENENEMRSDHVDLNVDDLVEFHNI
jgi:hypothetical protein